MDRAGDGQTSCQHQVQYLVEVELNEDTVPKIGDGEVRGIILMTLDEVRSALANGECKMNCANTWLAFLIRHGHITVENEPNLVLICSRLHRKLYLFIV